MYADTFKFIIVIFLIFFPSGKIILDLLNLKATRWEKLLLSVNLGIVFVTICAFLLGFLGNTKIILILVWLPLLYLVITQGKQFIETFKENFLKVDLILVLVLFFCVFVLSLITFPSGDVTDKGLKLVGIHSSDSIWYIALINNLEKSIPPQNPTFSNQVIDNYHYFTFIFASLIKSVTNIPAFVLYFKLFIPFLAFLFCSTVFLFVKSLTENRWAGLFAVLVTALSSNLYYLVSFIYPGANVSPSVFWADEYITRMVNPQLLMSFIVLLTILYLLLNIKKIREIKFIIIFSLLTGSLIGFKSFAAAVFLPALAILALLHLKNDFAYIKLLLASLVVTALFFFGLIKDSASFLIYSPFWFIKTAYESSDHLNFSQWELKRQTYLSEGNILRVIQLYAEGTLVFIIANLGTKLLGFLALFQRNSLRKKEIIQLLVLIAASGFLFSILTISKGIAWNSIQFFYFTILSLGILSATVVGNIFKKNLSAGILAAAFVWILLLPGVFFSSRYYLSEQKTTFISADLLEAAKNLAQKEDGVVLINQANSATSILPSLSNKSAFFADETQLVITGVDFAKRKQEVDLFFSGQLDDAKTYLLENKIDYILTANPIPEYEKLEMQQIFKNNTVIIYQNRFMGDTID